MNKNINHVKDDTFYKKLSVIRFFIISLSTTILLTVPLFSEPESSTEPEKETSKQKNAEPTSDQNPFSGEVCSIGGCSIGHHSIPALAPSTYRELLKQFDQQPISSESKAFEKLLYYGRQTRSYINQNGTPSLGNKRSRVLKNELSRTHVNVSVRITDEHGNTRVQIHDHTVPLGESKHFHMNNTRNIPPPELSGTVYRVGVHHLWARYWVEGVHFVNGPWFTVQQIGKWKTLGNARISNGNETIKATIELKLELEEADGSETALRINNSNSSPK